jgi:hypothetical protein
MEVFRDLPITIFNILANRLEVKNEYVVSFLYLKVVNKSRKYMFHLTTIHLQKSLLIFSVPHIEGKNGYLLSMVVGVLANAK